MKEEERCGAINKCSSELLKLDEDSNVDILWDHYDVPQQSFLNDLFLCDSEDDFIGDGARQIRKLNYHISTNNNTNNKNSKDMNGEKRMATASNLCSKVSNKRTKKDATINGKSAISCDDVMISDSNQNFAATCSVTFTTSNISKDSTESGDKSKRKKHDVMNGTSALNQASVDIASVTGAGKTKTNDNNIMTGTSSDFLIQMERSMTMNCVKLLLTFLHSLQMERSMTMT